MAFGPERKRVKCDIRLDPDQDRWIRDRAEADSISVSAVVRQIVRAAMGADERAAKRAAKRAETAA